MNIYMRYKIWARIIIFYSKLFEEDMNACTAREQDAYGL